LSYLSQEKFRLGEACSHIGALLFLIAEQVASGKNLPDDLSATDQLCAWKHPKREMWVLSSKK
jgi:hypothetical protein